MTRSLSRRLVLLLAGALPVVAAAGGAPCCGPVTADGARLARFLDGTGVDHLWLPGFRVDWQTGTALEAWHDSRSHTHCSAFAASAAMRLGVYVLRPPEHRETLLANAQMRWLAGPEAAAGGWQPLADAEAAQAAANQGRLVLAAFENPDPHKAGHIAIVRPGDIDAATLAEAGPLVTQAGAQNALSVPLARGFAHHPGAWLPGGGGAVRFFAHPIDWTHAPS
jgi:hypothetical protein